jgi:hypothetical protein
MTCKTTGNRMLFLLPCSVWRVIITAVGEGESDVGSAEDDPDLHARAEPRWSGRLQSVGLPLGRFIQRV